MKKAAKWAAAVWLGVWLAAAPLSDAAAASLWVDGSRSLFSDHKASAVGDIVTIIISESSKATRTGSSANSKSGETGWAAGSGIFHFLAAADAKGNDSFKSNGSISNSNSVSGRITVEVTEVKPNGNLVIKGTQSIKQNKDDHIITLTGVIRPDDIAWDNTILSSYVSDAKLFFDGKGPISAKQRQGILTQLFNFIF